MDFPYPQSHSRLLDTHISQSSVRKARNEWAEQPVIKIKPHLWMAFMGRFCKARTRGSKYCLIPCLCLYFSVDFAHMQHLSTLRCNLTLYHEVQWN